MRTSKNAPAIALAVLVALALIAADWLLFLSPNRSAASDAHAATATQIAQNQTLTVQLQKRKADFARLPELKAQVWSIRDQMPPKEDAAAIRDLIDVLAIKHGLVVQSDSIGAAADVKPGLALADTFAPFGMESYVDKLTFTGLSFVPLTLGMQGSYDSVMAFLDELQLGDHRYFLVSTLAVKALAEDPSTNPPSHAGDIQVTIAGYFFVLDHGVAGITERPAGDPMPGTVPLPGETVPAPSTDRNFLVPAR
jgi:Tfp pilus assembly protein PilO